MTNDQLNNTDEFLAITESMLEAAGAETPGPVAEPAAAQEPATSEPAPETPGEPVAAGATEPAAEDSAEPQTTEPANEPEPELDPARAFELQATDPDARATLEALEALAALMVDDDAHEVADPDPSTLEVEPLDFAAEDDPAGSQEQADDVTPGLSADVDEVATSSDDDATAPADSPAGGDAATTDKIDHIELTALMENASAAQTVPFTPVAAATPAAHAIERVSGAAKGTGALAWGSRTDVGCIREHNEDSFVIRFPLFAVADGMGGHAAGEVASTIAVSTLANSAPNVPDAALLGDAIEAANQAVLDGARNGLGRQGMGTTCTSVVIDGSTMAVGHVGDSRCYLLHAGQLVRVTHDHSYVEELVAAGEITPEEARIHPNRSIITRALGSDPRMKADRFTVDVARGDRVLLCSDGLSSMITDDVIEEAMVSTVAPQACADALVGLALSAGGHDNVTCIVIDVKDDGVSRRALVERLRNLALCFAVVAAVLLVTFLGLLGLAQNQWYLADANGYVAVYRGIPGAPEELGLSKLDTVTDIKTSQLSDAVENRLIAGISFESESEARDAVAGYRERIAQDQAAQAASSASVELARAAAAETPGEPAAEPDPALDPATETPGATEEPAPADLEEAAAEPAPAAEVVLAPTGDETAVEPAPEGVA